MDVELADLDRVIGLLWSGGVTAIQELDLGTGRARLIAGLPPSAEPELARTLAGHWTPDFFDAEFEGWLDAWRPFARSVRVGRLVVTPPWERVEPAEGEIVVEVDPGRSFGAGNHPTTRLMLGLMQDVLRPDATVLDVGSGSGVLSVAAAALGAARVTAVDLEEEALRATRENASRNGFEDRIEVSDEPIGELRVEFDVVLANVLAPVLIELASDVSAAVAVGGSLLLSGILSGQVDEVAAAYRGWEAVEEVAEEDWRALRLLHR